MIQLIECPRDAMQGLEEFIPTEEKVRYINQLLKVGFHTIDFGSFVSPKAVPQMKDTADVLKMLDLTNSETKLLAIVANVRGAVDACAFEEVDYLGYPFSISETFQLRNTNATIEDSIRRLSKISEIAKENGKDMVVYISMGFGNPYGDEWNTEIVKQWTEKLVQMEVEIISLSDTIGVANPESISYLFGDLIPAYPEINFGAHLHTQPHNWKEKVVAAYENGCMRFDAAIKGYGGCPMARDELTGNMPTENLVYYFEEIEEELNMDRKAFNQSLSIAMDIFPHK